MDDWEEFSQNSFFFRFGVRVMNGCMHEASPRLIAQLKAAKAEIVGGGEDEDGKFHVVRCAKGHKSSWQVDAKDPWSCTQCTCPNNVGYVVSGGQVHAFKGDRFPDVAWLTTKQS